MTHLKAYFVGTIVLSILSGPATFAGEDVGTTVKNSAGDVGTAGKKTGRYLGRQARKVTGNDTRTKDAEDRANNAKDNAENDATKAKNRAQENQ